MWCDIISQGWNADYVKRFKWMSDTSLSSMAPFFIFIFFAFYLMKVRKAEPLWVPGRVDLFLNLLALPLGDIASLWLLHLRAQQGLFDLASSLEIMQTEWKQGLKVIRSLISKRWQRWKTHVGKVDCDEGFLSIKTAFRSLKGAR